MANSANSRIGILTFHRGANYGGFLQAWHSLQAIRKMGYDAQIINYQSQAHYDAERIRICGFSTSQIKGLLHQTLKALPFYKSVRSLTNDHLYLNPTEVPWHHYSKVMIGSDIVWEHTNPLFGSDLAYYGALECQRETELISYAASCGKAFDHNVPLEIREGLRKFQSVFVRDSNTQRFAEQAIGSTPPIVVDPTWLGDDLAVSYRKRPSKPYALLYGLGAAGDIGKSVHSYCSKRGLRLISVSAQCPHVDTKIFSLNPFEWVDLFRHATCVITSTFHGLLYAIKYNKPVIFLEREASYLKASIAIDRCGLADRVWQQATLWTEDQIHYALGDNRSVGIPEAWAEQSLDLLGEALGRK